MELDDEAKAIWAKGGQAYFGNTKSYDEWVEYMVAFVEKFPNYLEVSEGLNVDMFKMVDINKDGVVRAICSVTLSNKWPIISSINPRG